ncbi:hypothetical protein CO540_04790 [Micromonospora sp. WMMA2032]|uniref:vWA domain-containing protein n=1 Tax=Micromonospora sp. WMMA2032 TaxID=2039870 RepID=UPI000C0599F4|nr:hypothetical protein [Micromonospora sp. WMMA2032]ATO13227.1 hypothetical protein CO540_04790 [Micromonospora sp. WMMA2032]
MNQPLPLILRTEPVQRGLFNRVRATPPNEACVYATADRRLVLLDAGRPLSWSEQVRSPYRFRYNVDMSDHRRTAELRSTPLPARGDHWFFVATVDVGFRVHDPVEIVRRNVGDALPLVYGHLRHRFRRITRQFEIEQSTEAEEAIRRAYAGEVLLPEGLTIFDVAPRLLPDENASRHLQEVARARRTLRVNEGRHAVDLQEALQRGELERMQQRARLEADERERAALGPDEMSVRQMVVWYVARNPQDTEQALNLLMAHEQAMLERQDAHNQKTVDLFRFLVEKDVLHAADIEPMLPDIVSRIGGVPAKAPVAAATTWSEPPVLGGPASQPSTDPPGRQPAIVFEQDPTTRVWKPADGVQPVYLLIDESTEMGPYIPDLSDGARALHEELMKAADVAPAVMLSVLGFADHVATRLPMETVVQGSPSPWFAARGPVSYANAFEALLDRIGPDMETLKTQGYQVLQPLVHVLSGSSPGEGEEWGVPYRRLVDPETHRWVPNIVACGFGPAPARLIAEVATRPQSGHVAPQDLDARIAIQRYWQSLGRNILATGRSLIEGRPELAMDPPAGFRLAHEVI